MNLPVENPLLTVFGGNSGNVGTDQQRRGLQRSHLNNENGNVGTQLCSINSHPPTCVPTEKEWDQIDTLKPAFQSSFVHVPTFPLTLRFQT